jgi:N-acetylglutamate synthase-like GNAT family acetyltransferase
MIIEKPKVEDLETISQILKQWTESEEVEKYLSRINSEINGQTEYSMNFWVAKENSLAIGVGGLAKPLPTILPMAKSKNPGEIKILYIDNNYRGQGVGRKMINFLENEAKNQNYQELFIRSAQRYQDTAYGFYEKMGYIKLCELDNNMGVFYKMLK